MGKGKKQGKKDSRESAAQQPQAEEVSVLTLVRQAEKATALASTALKPLLVALQGLSPAALEATLRKCVFPKCGETFVAKRKDAKFCSVKCRRAAAQQAFRDRAKAEGDEPAAT